MLCDWKCFGVVVAKTLTAPVIQHSVTEDFFPLETPHLYITFFPTLHHSRLKNSQTLEPFPHTELLLSGKYNVNTQVLVFSLSTDPPLTPSHFLFLSSESPLCRLSILDHYHKIPKLSKTGEKCHFPETFQAWKNRPWYSLLYSLLFLRTKRTLSFCSHKPFISLLFCQSLLAFIIQHGQ